MRIATYNVEWFSRLFSRDNRLLIDRYRSGRHDVTRGDQINALAHVFRALNADVILVIEAPNTGGKRSSEIALETFARTFDLRCSQALGGFASGTLQEITLMFDPDFADAKHDPVGTRSPPRNAGLPARFDGDFWPDDVAGGLTDKVVFSKPPLEVLLRPRAGSPLRLIGVHAKSKAPHGGTSAQEIAAIAIENRRKQLAQCLWLRNRVDGHLDTGEPLIVLGDFNDGPGLDEYEALFGRSGVEIVLGRDGSENRMLYDANAEAVLNAPESNGPASSRFYLAKTGGYLNALLDYIMVSPDLRARAPDWEIWHPFDNPKCKSDDQLQESLLVASDHFPVALDISF